MLEPPPEPDPDPDPEPALDPEPLLDPEPELDPVPPELEPDVLPPEPAPVWDPPGEFGLLAAGGGGELVRVDAEFPVPPQAVKNIEEAASKAATRTGLQRIGAPNYSERWSGRYSVEFRLDTPSCGLLLPPAIVCRQF